MTNWPLLNRARNYGIIGPDWDAEPHGDCNMMPWEKAPKALDRDVQPISLQPVVEHYGVGPGEVNNIPFGAPFSHSWMEWQLLSGFCEKSEVQGPAFLAVDLIDVQESDPNYSLIVGSCFSTAAFLPRERRFPLHTCATFAFHRPRVLELGARVPIATEKNPKTLETLESCGLELRLIGNRQDSPLEIQWAVCQIILFAWWALILMTCKNADFREVHPSTRMEKAKIDPARVVYRELVVKPAPGQRSVGTPRDDVRGTALHIVRGHFKDYTEHPLFGQHRGRYWWAPHTAGDVNFGTVLKSYSLDKQTSKT